MQRSATQFVSACGERKVTATPSEPRSPSKQVPCGRQSMLQAGSGFLAQHSKEVFFGVGVTPGTFGRPFVGPAGSRNIFDAIPVGHRIEVEEGSRLYGQALFTSSATSRTSPPPAQQPLPARIGTWLIAADEMRRNFPCPVSMATCSATLKDFRGGFTSAQLLDAQPPRCPCDS